MTQDELKMVLEALESCDAAHITDGGHQWYDEKLVDKAITAIEEALAEHAMKETQRLGQEIEQEPVMILPDGSAFGVMSFPLPDDHWLYAPNEYKDGEYEPIDLPKPILTHELRDAVVAAVRYAVRGATMRGQETDFDPDALVQNAVYALCGPYATPPQRTEPVATLDDLEQEIYENTRQFVSRDVMEWMLKRYYTTPPQRTEPVIDKSAAIRIATVLGWTPPRPWVGLTDEEIWTVLQFRGYNTDTIEIARAIEAKLKQKNGYAEEKNT